VRAHRPRAGRRSGHTPRGGVRRVPRTLARAIAFATVTLAAPALVSAPALAATVTGVVVDRRGQPVELANVAVPSVKRGAVTDAQGRFTL
jgi:uncharacterized protein (DUF2336 family)